MEVDFAKIKLSPINLPKQCGLHIDIKVNTLSIKIKGEIVLQMSQKHLLRWASELASMSEDIKKDLGLGYIAVVF